MDKIITKLTASYAFAVTCLAAVFGKFWFLFFSFLLLNIADYITGIIKARYSRTENSGRGLRGILKKVGCWLVIAIAFFISVSFSVMGQTIGLDLNFLQLMGWFTLATFIINEIRSILENLVQIGVEVPLFLVRGLEVAANLVKERHDGN